MQKERKQYSNNRKQFCYFCTGNQCLEPENFIRVRGGGGLLKYFSVINEPTDLPQEAMDPRGPSASQVPVSLWNI